MIPHDDDDDHCGGADCDGDGGDDDGDDGDVAGDNVDVDAAAAADDDDDDDNDDDHDDDEEDDNHDRDYHGHDDRDDGDDEIHGCFGPARWNAQKDDWTFYVETDVKGHSKYHVFNSNESTEQKLS